METSCSEPVLEIVQSRAGEHVLAHRRRPGSADHRGTRWSADLPVVVPGHTTMGKSRRNNAMGRTVVLQAASAFCRGAWIEETAWVGGGVPYSTSLEVSSGRRMVALAPPTPLPTSQDSCTPSLAVPLGPPADPKSDPNSLSGRWGGGRAPNDAEPLSRSLPTGTGDASRRTRPTGATACCWSGQGSSCSCPPRTPRRSAGRCWPARQGSDGHERQ